MKDAESSPFKGILEAQPRARTATKASRRTSHLQGHSDSGSFQDLKPLSGLQLLFRAEGKLFARPSLVSGSRQRDQEEAKPFGTCRNMLRRRTKIYVGLLCRRCGSIAS